MKKIAVAEIQRHCKMKSRATVANWKRDRPDLYSILVEHYLMSKNPDCTLNYVRAKIIEKD